MVWCACTTGILYAQGSVPVTDRIPAGQLGMARPFDELMGSSNNGMRAWYLGRSKLINYIHFLHI